MTKKLPVLPEAQVLGEVYEMFPEGTKITPNMIEAGFDVMLEYDGDELLDRRVVEEVFLAMQDLQLRIVATLPANATERLYSLGDAVELKETLEVTPEMVAAGLDAMQDRNADNLYSHEAVSQIYRAMRVLAPLPEGEEG